MMADPRAFVSFDFDHNEDEKTLFIGQSRNSRTPFTIQDWSAKVPMPQDEWEDMVEEKMRRTNMVIVLVGRYMKTATGVVKEIKMAQENNVPIFGVYVGGADSMSNLPDGLSRSRTITWTWPGIAAMVDQMMNEGKNKKSWF